MSILRAAESAIPNLTMLKPKKDLMPGFLKGNFNIRLFTFIIELVPKAEVLEQPRL
jgi:hypothetical protein